MKKQFCLLFFITLFPVSHVYSAISEDITQQYSNYSTERNWLAIGVNYAFFIQNDRAVNPSFGNAVDVSTEIYFTRFLSLYTGYQYMGYEFIKDSLNDELKLENHKFLLGGRVYIWNLFIGGGAYKNWTHLTERETQKQTKEEYWGGYLDFGYRSTIINNLLTFETGARFYFTPDKVNNGQFITAGMTNTVPRKGDKYFHWDYFLGVKVLI